MHRIVLFVLLFSYTELAVSDECESPWVKVGTKCLWKTKDLASYADNLRICQYFGGTLASPKTPEENNLLKSFIGNEIGHYWTSGQRVSIGSEEFRWLDGSPLTYTDWQPENPNHFQDPSPVCLLIDGTNGWDDYLCNSTYSQICEKPVKIQPQVKDKTESDTQESEEIINVQNRIIQKQRRKIKDLESQCSGL